MPLFFRSVNHLRILTLCASLVLMMSGWLVYAGYPPWHDFMAEWITALGLCLYLLTQTKVDQRFSVDPWILLFTATAAVSAAASTWILDLTLSGDFLIVICYLILYFLSFHAGKTTSTFNERAKNWSLAPYVAVSLAGLLIAYICLIQWLNISWQPFWAAKLPSASLRAEGNFGQSNHAGTALALTIFATIWLYIKKILSWGTTASAIMLLTFALVITDSRTALLSATATTLFVAFHLKICNKLSPALLALIILGVFSTVAARHTKLPLEEFLFLTINSPRQFELDQVRLGLWKQILAGTSNAGWFGTGWLNTAGAQYLGAKHHIFQHQSVGTNFSHNLFVDLIAWNGWLIGVLLSAIILIFAFSSLRDSWKNLNATPVYFSIPFAIHCLLEYPHAYLYLAIPSLFILGSGSVDRQFKYSLSISKTQLQAMTAAVAIGSALLFWVYMQWEEYTRYLRFQDRRFAMNDWTIEEPAIKLSQIKLLTDNLKIRQEDVGTLEAFTLLDRSRKRYSGAAYQANLISFLAKQTRYPDCKTELQRFSAVHGSTLVIQLRDNFKEKGMLYEWNSCQTLND